MLSYERHSQGMEEHAFTDDRGVCDGGRRDEFTKCERIELEDGVENGGYGDRRDDREKKAEIFLCGRVVPEDGIRPRDNDDQEDRYDEIGGIEEV